MGVWGRKDGFPGADGSTIQQSGIPNSETIAIYGADGSVLTEGSTGVQFVDVEDVVNGNTSLVYAIKNPLTYIYTATALNDWYTTNSTYQNNTLWQDDTKGIFDPCPYGWQVPPNSEQTWGDFSSFTTSYYIQGKTSFFQDYAATNGLLYRELSWFPTAGYRIDYSGLLGGVGYGGNVRAATVSGIYAKDFNFNMEGLTINYLHYRSVGISVRCVQE